MDDGAPLWIVLAHVVVFGVGFLIHLAKRKEEQARDFELPPDAAQPPVERDARPLDRLVDIPRPIHPTSWISHRVRLLAVVFLLFGSFIPFAIVGLALAAWHIRVGSRWLRALRRGHYLRGRVVGRKTTWWKINKRPVVVYDVEFYDPDGARRTLRVRSHRSAMVDRWVVGIFCDPARPEAAVVEECSAFVLSLDDAGHWAPRWGYTILLAAVTGVMVFALGDTIAAGWAELPAQLGL